MSVISYFSSHPTARSFAKSSAFVLLMASISVPVQAGLISAQEASIESASKAFTSPQAGLRRLLDREGVVRALQNQGVSIELARQRLAALTDDEARQLQTDIDSAPAGAGIVCGVVLVFLVLLATDITGHTDVFPFTRRAR